MTDKPKDSDLTVFALSDNDVTQTEHWLDDTPTPERTFKAMSVKIMPEEIPETAGRQEMQDNKKFPNIFI
jgi:hypothetical protein